MFCLFVGIYPISLFDNRFAPIWSDFPCSVCRFKNFLSVAAILKSFRFCKKLIELSDACKKNSIEPDTCLPWYLYQIFYSDHVVHVWRTIGLIFIVFQNTTAVDLNKCLKQKKLPISLDTVTPTSEVITSSYQIFFLFLSDKTIFPSRALNF